MKKIIAYQILNCGHAIIIYEENGKREKVTEKFPNFEELGNSGGVNLPKTDNIDKYVI